MNSLMLGMEEESGAELGGGVDGFESGKS